MFKAQWDNPVKDNWTLEVKKNLEELNITLDLEEIKRKSANSFKRLVKTKAKESTLDYLLNLSEKHEKMENLHYTDLELHNYLKDAKIPEAEAKNLFRFRTRSAKFKANMKNGYSTIT